VPRELINEKWKIITPNNNEVLLIPNYEKERLDIKNTYELGSYDVYINNDFFTAFSTSLSEFESPKIRTDLYEMVNQFKSGGATIMSEGSDIAALIKSQRHGISLWRLFLIAALFLFLIESLLSRPIKRKIRN